MAKENLKLIDVLQFVDENHTGSLIAEAMAKQHLQERYSAPKRIVVFSTGTDVKKLREARRQALRVGSTKSAETLAQQYIKTARESGYKITDKVNLQNPDTLKYFMEILIGDKRTQFMSSILKGRKLKTYINRQYMSNPQQTNISLLQGDNLRIRAETMIVCALNSHSFNGAENAYRGTLSDYPRERSKYCKTILRRLTPEVEITNISFAQQAQYEKVLAELRTPVMRAVDDYMKKRALD